MIQRGDFWASPAGQEAFVAIGTRIRQYWATHVYNFYHRHDGKLGNACEVKLVDGHIVVSLKPMIDPETGYDYAHAIHHGVRAGPGAYDPEMHVRHHGGWYPGVSVAKYWRPWITSLRPVVASIVRQEVQKAMRQYIRQQLVVR